MEELLAALAALARSRLSPRELRVVLALLSLGAHERPARVSQRRLAAMTGVSQPNVARALSELQRKGTLMPQQHQGHATRSWSVDNLWITLSEGDPDAKTASPPEAPGDAKTASQGGVEPNARARKIPPGLSMNSTPQILRRVGGSRGEGDHEPPAPPAPPAEPKGRRLDLSELPVAWHVWADEELEPHRDLGVSCERMWEQFRDHFSAQPGVKGRKTDWEATWRNWVRREVERLRLGRLPKSTRKASTSAQRLERPVFPPENRDAAWRALIKRWGVRVSRSATYQEVRAAVWERYRELQQEARDERG